MRTIRTDLCPACGWPLKSLVHVYKCPSVRASGEVLTPSAGDSRVKTRSSPGQNPVPPGSKPGSKGGRPLVVTRAEVVALLEGGLSKSAAARALGVSLSTVKRRAREKA